MRGSGRVLRGHAMALAVALAACAQPGAGVPGPRDYPRPPEVDRNLWRAAVTGLRDDGFEPLVAVELAAAVGSTCARDRNGGVWCWGDGFVHGGAPGVPEAMPLAGEAVGLDGHDRRYCAMLSNGYVQCWSGSDTVATVVRAPPTAALTVGNATILLRRSDGQHVCWSVAHGRPCWFPDEVYTRNLTDGSVACLGRGVDAWRREEYCSEDRAVRLGPTPRRCEGTDYSPGCRALRLSTPGRVVVTAEGKSLSLADAPGCALDAGIVQCMLAQLHGTAHGFDDGARVRIPLDEPAVQLVIPREGAHACALGVSGRVACWGDNSRGAVGLAPVGGSTRPIRIDTLRDIADIGAYDRTFCALDDAGGLWCWGFLGCDERQPVSAVPRLLAHFERPEALSVHGGGACVTAAGAMHCFGLNLAAAAVAGAGPLRGVSHNWHVCTLHDTDVICRESRAGGPRCGAGDLAVAARVGPAVAIAEPCALMPNGDVRCWDRLGMVTSAISGQIVQLRSSPYQWCGREADGDVVCQSTGNSLVRHFDHLAAVDLDVDGVRACIVDANGGIRCFSSYNPIEVVPITDARRVAVGRDAACALLVDHSVVCWGGDDTLFGRGYTAQISEPLPVVKRRDP